MAVLQAYYNLVPVTLLQGVIYAFVALGIMIPFRLLSFPDLTAEGSFPLGASVSAAVLAAGADPVSATALAIAAGFAAGATTALIHRIFRLNTLLCGILVVTMLYSIDIRIMGKPNIPLFTYDDMFSVFLGDWSRSLAARIAFVSAIAIICTIALYCFLRTEMGLALRAVGVVKTLARQVVDVLGGRVEFPRRVGPFSSKPWGGPPGVVPPPRSPARKRPWRERWPLS